MTINFDERIDRRHTQAISVDECRSAVFHEDAQTAKFPCPDDQVIRMWIADMDFAAPPCVLEALHRRVEHGIFGYTDITDDSFSTAFFRWCDRMYGWTPPKEQLCFSHGIVPALCDLVPMLTQPDEKVLFLTPSYPPFRGAAVKAGREYVCSDMLRGEDGTLHVENMKAASVTGMMEIGFDLPSSEKAVRLAERFSWVHAAVGSHPDDAAQVDEARIAVYRELCKNPRVKAIGEIGLDYHYEDPPRDVQQRAFRLQMALAQELSMPVVVHERKAHEDGLRIIDEFPDVKGVFHCFSGSYEMAKELIKRGWCIGFTGVVTFKNAHKAVEVAQNIPLDRILIETDCPYMAPEPFRGRRCDPSLVPYVAKKIADLRGIPAEEVARATESNARRVFRL